MYFFTYKPRKLAKSWKSFEEIPKDTFLAHHLWYCPSYKVHVFQWSILDPCIQFCQSSSSSLLSGWMWLETAAENLLTESSHDGQGWKKTSKESREHIFLLHLHTWSWQNFGCFMYIRYRKQNIDHNIYDNSLSKPKLSSLGPGPRYNSNL